MKCHFSQLSKAEIAGRSILIGFDANSELGPKWIQNDPHGQSDNRKTLGGNIQRYALIVANGNPEKCTGVVTRRRNTIDNIEESDYVSLNIDEEKKYSLTSCTRTKKGIVKKESDHNTLLCKFHFKYNPQIKEHNIEIFNFKDIAGLEKYKCSQQTTINSLKSQKQQQQI